ncbi:hypothetical protein Tco_0924318 [Tanacetum coccineum]|uniref:Uncharacterized protein n=1 Tax=Tanacetum coccineum TaxID=301880 RepID=A0ABQ5D9V3_9ASTR
MEEEKSVRNNEVVDKNVVEPNKSDITASPEEVDKKDEVKNRTNDEPVRSIEGDPTGERVRELVEMPSKMECEAYHLLLIKPIRKAMLKKLITKKEDMRVNFVIPCYMDALVDQGFNMKVIPLSTYKRLTDEELVETGIRLSLANQSHIYPLGIAKDVWVEIAKREKDKIDPITPISTVSKRILEWKERIKFHQEKELDFKRWRGKLFNDKNSTATNDEITLEDEEGVMLYLMRRSPGVLRTHGWILEEINVTCAHLEKKQTRLQLYTKADEEMHTVARDGVTIKCDGVRTYKGRRDSLNLPDHRTSRWHNYHISAESSRPHAHTLSSRIYSSHQSRLEESSEHLRYTSASSDKQDLLQRTSSI